MGGTVFTGDGNHEMQCIATTQPFPVLCVLQISGVLSCLKSIKSLSHLQEPLSKESHLSQMLKSREDFGRSVQVGLKLQNFKTRLPSPHYLTTEELPISLVILPTLKNPCQVSTCFSGFKSLSKRISQSCSRGPLGSCSKTNREIVYQPGALPMETIEKVLEDLSHCPDTHEFSLSNLLI